MAAISSQNALVLLLSALLRARPLTYGLGTVRAYSECNDCIQHQFLGLSPFVANLWQRVSACYTVWRYFINGSMDPVYIRSSQDDTNYGEWLHVSLFVSVGSLRSLHCTAFAFSQPDQGVKQLDCLAGTSHSLSS